MARAYPGIFLLIALAGGILAADFLRASAPAFLLAALGGLVAAAAALVFRRPSAAAVFFGLVLAGLSAAHFARDTYDLGSRSLGRYADSRTRYRLVGRVDDWPELRPDRIELTVRLDSLGPDRMAAVEGRLLLRIADTGAAVQFGDRVELSTRLYPAAERGEGAASRRSLLVKGVGALAYVRASQDVRRLPRPAVGLIPVVDTVRAAIGQSLRRTLSPRAAALAGGFLIGDTRDIPPDLYRAFRDSGTLHVLAVSGSNVAVVVGFVLVLLRPFRTGRVARTLILLVVVVFFALLCRGEPSVVRASVMAALILLARLAGRRIDLNNLVALAAAAILLCAPAQLFSVGFQLSFATAWGLVFVTPRVYRLLEGRALGPPARWLSLAVIVSLTAQLFSAPLVACYFHRVPLLGPAANLVIVPLVSAAVVGVLATLTLDFVWPPLGALAGALVDRLMDLILGALGLFSGERAPVLDTGALPPAAAVAAYAALIVAGFALGSLPVRRRAVLGGLVLLNGALAWLALGPRPPRVVCDIHITRVPGGVAAAIVPAGAERADLVITNLAARDYPVVDRVLIPWLERLGRPGLGRVVLLSADYAGAAELARFADSLRADTLFVHGRLHGTMGDIAARSGRCPPWRPFGGAEPPAGEGLALCAWGAVLAARGLEILFLRTDGDLAAARCAPDRACWLVCGDEAAADDLRSIGRPPAGLVCAEFAQTEPDSVPAAVFDLRRFGSVRLRLTAGAAPSVRVETGR